VWCKVFKSGRDRRNVRYTALPFMLLKALAIATILLCGSWGSGRAAPFCLQIYGQLPQCIYVDSRECYRSAIRQHGNCTYNPAEVSLPKFATQRFCMVFTGPIFDCAFSDRRSCEVQVVSRGGICVDRTPQQPDVDLFRR
jgi:hypothetical protein